jgi:hypothetical protein
VNLGDLGPSVRTSPRSGACLVALLALCLTSCGAQRSVGSTDASVVSDASTLTTLPDATEVDTSTQTVAPAACTVPADFDSAPVPATYPLRTDAPESDAPVDLSVKRPISSSAQAAVDDVVNRLDFLDVSVARIGGPPSPDAFGPWLYVLATVPAVGGALIARPQWEAVTILGAAAEMAATGNELGDAIEGWVLDLQTPDCQIVSETSTRIGPRASGQVFAATGDAADTEFATGVLDKYGVTPVKVETFRAVSQILIVTASISSAEAMNGNLSAMFEELKGVPLRFESLYLQLQTSSGEDLAVLGSSPRIGSGLVWVQPGLEDVLGIMHG